MLNRIATTVLGLLLVSGVAMADTTSLVTGSVGTQMGITHTQQADETAESNLVSELELTMKLFRFIGFEMSYNPAAPTNAENELVFHSRLRLAGQLHLLPLDDFSMYVSAGLGAEDFTGFSSLTEDGNAYQGGLGAEVFIGDHFAVGAEYLMVVPGIRSIQHQVVANALEASLGEGGASAAAGAADVSATDYVSPSNFQATVGVRYYF